MSRFECGTCHKTWPESRGVPSARCPYEYDHGYLALRGLYVLDDQGDPWGTSTEFLFALAEVIHHEADCIVPSAWEFCDSPMHTTAWDRECPDWPESEISEMLWRYEITANDMIEFGNVLIRYRNFLRSVGRDY